MNLEVEQVRVKKYFYVLRPIFAAKWILDKECPPLMLFSKLMESELENSIRPEVDKLLKMKQELPEMGLSPRVQVLNDYIEAELSNIKGTIVKTCNSPLIFIFLCGLNLQHLPHSNEKQLYEFQNTSTFS